MLASTRFGGKVAIMGDKDSSKLCRPVEQVSISQEMSIILERGQYIYASQPQPVRNGLGHILVKVELDRQLGTPVPEFGKGRSRSIRLA